MDWLKRQFSDKGTIRSNLQRDFPANHEELWRKAVAAVNGEVGVKSAEEVESEEKEALRKRVAGLEGLIRLVPAGRTATKAAVYDWVADHLYSSAEDLEVEEIPRRSALNFLIEAVKSPEGMREFLNRHRGLAGTSEAADIERRFETNTEKLEAFIDKVGRQWDRAHGVVIADE